MARGSVVETGTSASRTGEWCRQGLPNVLRHGTVCSGDEPRGRVGGLAEYVSVDADQVSPLPGRDAPPPEGAIIQALEHLVPRPSRGPRPKGPKRRENGADPRGPARSGSRLCLISPRHRGLRTDRHGHRATTRLDAATRLGADRVIRADREDVAVGRFAPVAQPEGRGADRPPSRPLRRSAVRRASTDAVRATANSGSHRNSGYVPRRRLSRFRATEFKNRETTMARLPTAPLDVRSNRNDLACARGFSGPRTDHAPPAAGRVEGALRSSGYAGRTGTARSFASLRNPVKGRGHRAWVVRSGPCAQAPGTTTNRRIRLALRRGARRRPARPPGDRRNPR
jgi:hypothetical protein